MTGVASVALSDAGAEVDHRARRRDERRESNRAEILDAAERVFGELGAHEGSIRKIADQAGFSAAAIYLFFENKQHLLFETLSRRGNELIPLVKDIAARDGAPMDKLHGLVDAAVAFFAERPDFGRMLRRLAGGTPIIGPVLAEYADDADSRFDDTMAAIAAIIEAGQRDHTVRAGNARGLAHLYSVLVNEYVLGSADQTAAGRLSADEFHAVVDGAFRRGQPPRARRR
jgi:AcrR family transcriptional regulator